MTDAIENLVLEHLKRMQAELADIRKDTTEIKSRLGSIETGIARIGRDEAGNYSEIIQDRHIVDRLTERIERIERRLEIVG
ncbi:MAG: hypothetical protein NTV11_09935 [Rhodocyclales bacterium]|nr:hypothetical protein [Rhodocyclales bacterium]